MVEWEKEATKNSKFSKTYRSSKFFAFETDGDPTPLLEQEVEAALDVDFRGRLLVLVFFATTFWDLFAFDFAMFVELFPKCERWEMEGIESKSKLLRRR